MQSRGLGPGPSALRTGLHSWAVMDMRFLVAWDSPSTAEIKKFDHTRSRTWVVAATTRRSNHYVDDMVTCWLGDVQVFYHMQANTTHQRCHPAQRALLASHRQSDCAATRPAPRVRTYTHIGRVFCGTSDARPTAWGPRLHVASAATARPTTLSSVRPTARASHPKPLQGGQQEVTRVPLIT